LQIIITFVVGNWGLHAAHYNKADCIEHLQPWVLTQPLMPALSFYETLINKQKNSAKGLSSKTRLKIKFQTCFEHPRPSLLTVVY
jgi:hypothetical protein